VPLSLSLSSVKEVERWLIAMPQLPFSFPFLERSLVETIARRVGLTVSPPLFFQP